jgi:hypothetical protein
MKLLEFAVKFARDTQRGFSYVESRRDMISS